VDQAYEKVQEIFIEAISNSMDSLGDYFFEIFFDKNINRARKKQPTKQMSFLKLIERLQEAEADAPSKSWLYNAVNIAADKAHFEEIEFPEYKELSVTQRVYIARITDIEQKKEVIKETVANKYSVRDLKDRVGKMVGTRDQLSLEHLDDKAEREKLKSKTPARLESLIKTLEQKIILLNERKRGIDITQKNYISSRDAVNDVLKEMKKKQKGMKSK